MAAQTSSYQPQPANSISVVSPHFLAPYPVDLTIVKKLLSLSDGNFAVTDVNGNVMFKVKGKHISLRDRRLLLDAAGNPILSFQKKLISVHNRWVVFRGDSSDSKDLIFSAKQSSLIQFKTSLDVFLGHNDKENVCDFKVKGSWFDRSCTIYAGDGATIIAQEPPLERLKGHNSSDENIGTFQPWAFPEGIVPIRRTTEGDVLRAGILNNLEERSNGV